MKLSDAKFLLEELASEECQCGKYKKKGNSFCYNCYSSLPNDIQKRLYKRFRNGYEEAYEDAIEHLKE